MNSERGASTLTKIVFGAIFIALFYTGYCVIPFFYYYFEFQNQITAIVPVSDTLTDAQIRARLGKIIKDLGIPAEPGDLKIDRRDHFIKLSLKYQEVFFFSFQGKDYDFYTFHFTAEADGPF